MRAPCPCRFWLASDDHCLSPRSDHCLMPTVFHLHPSPHSHPGLVFSINLLLIQYRHSDNSQTRTIDLPALIPINVLHSVFTECGGWVREWEWLEDPTHWQQFKTERLDDNSQCLFDCPSVPQCCISNLSNPIQPLKFWIYGFLKCRRHNYYNALLF